ncbi:DUF4129 domain-containing protein [Amphibacillus indicireducens]|uniref:Protein-glutamine gamma-glutamyltransferase-like C-terminal domain-containing protein n=1 Tax=Amphibacillus indicireducens TaxID=1076330 RepID=A0ABP7V678_9BACI
MNQVESWRSTLDQILSEHEYQAYYQDNRNILQRIWDFVKEWVLDLIYQWFNGLTPSSATGDLIVAILFIVMAIVVASLAIYLLKNWQRRQRLKRDQPLKGLTINAQSLQDYQRSLEEAEANNNYQAAVRFRFLILLFELDQKQWLNKERWKTNWDYYQEIKRLKKDQAESFYQLAVYFEAVTYGNKQVERDDYLQYVRRAGGMK